MASLLHQQIRKRANNACEYCHLQEAFSGLKFHIEHITAKQHARDDTLANLALACGFCNRHKGPNIAGIDPDSNNLTRLFHPRLDGWNDHVRWRGARLVGLTDVGRATVAVLAMNHPLQVATRQLWIEAQGQLLP